MPTGRAPFEYGLVGAVVKSAAVFFADVKCQFAVAQMFLAGQRFAGVVSSRKTRVA
jgi:hypothetical protein